MKAVAFLLVVFAVAFAASCNGEEAPSGFTEPLRVRGAFFKSGAPPGGGASKVTAVELSSVVLKRAQVGKNLSGRISDNAVSVAISFADSGTGYWVVPAQGADSFFPGELTFRGLADFSPDIAPGPHPLRFVAIDANGNGGEPNEVQVCVESAVPDNVCTPTKRPPEVVFSLGWDVNADLDLVVIAPDGKQVDAKHPTTQADAGAGQPRGVIERDSNNACVIDGVRRENMVFAAPPASGPYTIYANLYDACGTSAVQFDFTLYELRDGKLTEVTKKQGRLLALEANGGSKLGLYVTEIIYP